MQMASRARPFHKIHASLPYIYIVETTFCTRTWTALTSAWLPNAISSGRSVGLSMASIEDGREFDGICLLNTPIQLDELWRGKGPAMRCWKGRWIRRCCPCQIPYNFLSGTVCSDGHTWHIRTTSCWPVTSTFLFLSSAFSRISHERITAVSLLQGGPVKSSDQTSGRIPARIAAHLLLYLHKSFYREKHIYFT